MARGLAWWLFGGYPYLDVYDVETSRILASFEMPKWSFDAAGFSKDNNYIIAGKDGFVYRLSVGDNSEKKLKIPREPDNLPGRELKGLSAESADGQTFVRLY